MDALQLGEFRIEAELGAGGSGTVYRAAWGPRKVALKVLHAELSGSDKLRAQFLAEAGRLQHIAHPSVVKVFGAGELPDGRPYLAMELLAGETLAHVVARGALPVARALELFGELASAVGALHAQGLVHRDLKPENVFVVDGKHAVLLDFGIAKELAAPTSTTTQDGHVRGTPAYMAPERFFGQAAGIATDVYELAVVLYAMLAARLPWQDLADPEARLQPTPLTTYAAVPDALDIELRRAMSTRPSNRPASAAALDASVRAAASGAITAPEPGETARMRPGDPDHPPAAEQPTPLAWAPTLAGKPTAPRARMRRRWPIAVSAVAVALVAGGVAWLRLRGEDAARPAASSAAASAQVTPAAKPPSAGSSASDPWNGAPPAIAKVLALTEARLTPETYRAEAAAAIARLPADTRAVVSIQIDELRAQPQTADLLAKLGKHPRVQELTAMLPTCVAQIATAAEWIVVGGPSLAGSEHGTLVARGRWQRAEVEACLTANAEPKQVRDGATLFHFEGIGWLDFIDDHTAYIALRGEADPEAVHELARHGGGPRGAARELIARLPADRTIAVVADGHGRDDWPSAGISLPIGSDVVGWLRVDPAAIALDLAADPHDRAAAARVVADVRPQIDELFAAGTSETIGKLEVVTAGMVVHVRGTMTALMISMISAAAGM